MEILASILIVASVALPVLAVLAIVGWVGLLIHSWIKDSRTEKAAEPVSEPAVATATTPVVNRKAASPAA